MEEGIIITIICTIGGVCIVIGGIVLRILRENRERRIHNKRNGFK